MIKKLKYRKKNKKAIFFTIMAISLLSLFLVSYSVYSFVQNREGINKRIKTMNNYVSSLEEDIPRKLYISGYRIIFLFEQKILLEGYIEDLNTKFSDAFFNGKIDGVDYRLENGQLLYDVTYPEIVEDINEKAKSLNLKVEFQEQSITITQDDPWHVKVILNSKLIIQDKGGLAKWERTIPLYTYIPIKNFEDPIYIRNTNAKVVNKFVQTPYDIPISVENLLNHAENSYYVAHDDAPNFLQRLEGDLTPDPDGNGIESLVNTHELPPETPPKERCIIDYLYFSSAGCEIAQTNNGWIKIDAEHLDLYDGG